MGEALGLVAVTLPSSPVTVSEKEVIKDGDGRERGITGVEVVY